MRISVPRPRAPHGLFSLSLSDEAAVAEELLARVVTGEEEAFKLTLSPNSHNAPQYLYPYPTPHTSRMRIPFNTHLCFPSPDCTSDILLGACIYYGSSFQAHKYLARQVLSFLIIDEQKTAKLLDKYTNEMDKARLDT